jgi:hypothetical protein
MKAALNPQHQRLSRALSPTHAFPADNRTAVRYSLFSRNATHPEMHKMCREYQQSSRLK